MSDVSSFITMTYKQMSLLSTVSNMTWCHIMIPLEKFRIGRTKYSKPYMHIRQINLAGEVCQSVKVGDIMHYWASIRKWMCPGRVTRKPQCGQSRPDFFSSRLPFIGYVEIRFEGYFYGGQRIKSMNIGASCFMSGLQYFPRDMNVYKGRRSSPWRFMADAEAEVKQNNAPDKK